MSDESLKLSDSVWHRVIQIFQEAIMTGVDCSDLLRQISVMHDPDNQSVLVLTPEYQQMVIENYEKLLKEAEELASQRFNNVIIGGDKGNN